MPNKKRFSSALTVAVALFAPALSSAQTPGAPEIQISRFVRVCLSQDHVDPNDDNALIAAVWSGKRTIAGCAARALGLHPATASIDQALLHAAQSPDFGLAGPAAVALVNHHNNDWTDDMVTRLHSIKDPLDKIRMAQTLALAGRYEGWDIIKSSIADKQPYITYSLEAAWAVPDFVGMKDPAGKPVDLVSELGLLHSVAQPEVQQAIRQAIIALGPPPPGGSKTNNPHRHTITMD